MAAISAEGSNKVILTSDNPRTEDPEMILDDMEAGITPDLKRKTLGIADRREAIRTAVMLAGRGDVILVAGKGHETYQEINGVKHHFDDREELRNALLLK
jgi:UDP-N-acetylmuramoyl-L-alanyl-D-glutamate--2,6-diaminopimelate ligase